LGFAQLTSKDAADVDVAGQEHQAAAAGGGAVREACIVYMV